MKKQFPKIIILLSFLVFSFSFLVFFWWSWATQAPASERAGESKTFIILKGESTDSIAQRLYQENLIRSPLAFKIILYKEMLVGKIQAGSFRLCPCQTPQEIGQTLTHGTEDVWVTIPEGWRSEEIVQALNKELSLDFTPDLKEFSLHEGYLFPDTYLFPKEVTSSLIIKKMQDNFSLKFTPKLREEAKNKGLSMEEIVILASLVEREVKHNEDRPIVAGILIKRWQNDWSLQVDATVQYAIANSQLENWWPKVTKDDLKISSSYNTYKYPGLPPTPICNPGLASIEAVIYSQETPYWYYLSDLSGTMRYATTIESHNQNISQYLQ